ncbi:DoxX family protein [Pontibacter toksunensis]|uniref:DoxX family protein n=1 Tax=Pontibacter toksunensis TaxID=1332631 RepID=A0ABW6BNM3_9BACT
MKSLFATSINPSKVHLALLLLRVVVACTMLFHGIPKLEKLLSGDFTFGDPIGIGSGPSLVLAAFAEFACSLLIFIGLGTRLATIPLIITMLVAAFIAHADDPITEKDLILLYLIVYSVLLLLGSGKYSVDHMLRKHSTVKATASV